MGDNAKKEVQYIDVSNLELDLYNPRLPKSKQGKDEPTVIDYMLLESATEELMLAIAENDFFAGELLLVTPIKENGNKFVVVEGNRRLTAVKLLLNPLLARVKKNSVKLIADEAKHKPPELPCLVFKDKSEILRYLGFRHITGIKSWRLLEKARYISDMKMLEYADLQFLEAASTIAKRIGSRSDYVKRLLIGYDLYKIVEDEDFYQIDGLNDAKFYLNYFTDSLNRENIRIFLKIDVGTNNPLEKLDLYNLEKITHWWFEKHNGKSRVLGDSEGLTLLDAVVAHPIAMEAFDSGNASIYEAFELTGQIDVQFENKIKESLKAIEKADLLSTKVKDFYSEMYEDLKIIRKIAYKILEFKQSIERHGDEKF